MFFITLLIASFYILIAVLEFTRIIPHHPLIGLFPFPMFIHWPYIVVHSFIFTFALLLGFTFLTKITSDIFRLEEDLFNSVQQLESADLNKQKYVMAIVHEIKTPLTAIHSYLSIILQKTLGEMPAPIEERLKRSLERSDEAVQLVNNVLRISRLRLLNELTKADFNFTWMLEQIVKKIASITDEKKLQLECSYDPNLIINFCGDYTLLNMAIQNVIGNAIKYTHAGGKILMTLQQEPEGLCLTIADTGIGIPEHESGSIFRDTFRASNAKQKGIEGAGFGLSIVKHIIEKHHGTIELKSPSGIGDEANPGTEVEIYIPYLG
jgi:two-component system phosphate regulon sensor histidine kinase PhoR